MYNVLIVDEEEHLLWALEQNLFPERDDISIETASDGEAGLELLQGNNVDLLISDIKMPGKIDGFQLILRAKEIAPAARVIIMTAFGTNRVQNFADRIGITHYIEKPFDTAVLRDAILEILDEKEGFQGVLSDLELTDIIQMLCLAKRTALLHLKHKDHRGKIVFDRGDVVHAEFDGDEGAEAVYAMLALRQGDIFMQSDFQSEQRTIDVGWQDLLFEGVKRADEMRLEDGSEFEDEEDESGPSTDVGMGLNSEEVDQAIGRPEEGLEAVSFFSDAELAEIEAASEAAMDEEYLESPHPSVGEASGLHDISNYLPGAVENSESVLVEAGSDEAENPFITEREGTGTDSHRAAVVPAKDIESESLAPPKMGGSEAEVENEQPEPVANAEPEVEQAEATSAAINPGGFSPLLEEFAAECPNLRLTGIISAEDGLAMNFVHAADGPLYEPEVIAAFFGDVLRGASRTVEAMFPKDKAGSIQIELESELVLVRRIVGTDYQHVVIVGKDASLGVALVLMRRFQKNIAASIGG
jgi:DNA-binding response OmpR family regulator/predicted regulator of Ras-like GTPase activity (Roadblock/LC7/MglB family)